MPLVSSEEKAEEFLEKKGILKTFYTCLSAIFDFLHFPKLV
jgi:hypothetical protein